MCPWEHDTWCKYPADLQKNTATYKDKPWLPAAVIELITPIYMDLSNDQLLKKCLHDKTQNNNDSIFEKISNGYLRWVYSTRNRNCFSCDKF